FRPVTDNNIFILADDSRLTRVSSKGSIVPGSFFVDPNNTYWIRLKDDSNPNKGHVIDVYELNSSFNSGTYYGGTAKSYIVLRNMTIEKYGSFGVGSPHDQVELNTHWEIDNLKCQFNVVGLSYASDDWYIHDCQFIRNENLGCQIDGSRVRFINNISNNNGGGIIIGGYAHSNTVRGCNFNKNGHVGGHGYGSGIYLENQSHSNLIENNIIDGNLHCGIGFYGGSKNTVINNIIINMSMPTWWKSTAAIVIGHSYLDDATQSVGNLIAYNTIWNCFIPLAILEPNRTIDPKEVNVFTNNAFLQYNKMFNKPNGLVANFNNNAFFNLWRINERNGIDKLDTHPINGVNPLLTSPQTNNFIPLSNSPLLDAGVTLNSVTTDIRGVLRPQGVYPDIGAYERTSTD
ncbi:MAG: choice-of-anchor Q domain-containing protein, partial [Pseudomonadota bacterium]